MRCEPISPPTKLKEDTHVDALRENTKGKNFARFREDTCGGC